MLSVEEARAKLIRLARKWRNDPLAFAQNAFTWGRGSLTTEKGPDVWQTELLTHLRDELQAGADVGRLIQTASAAGHGVGKSGCVAWIILWAMCTRADTRGVVTANTENQLRTKTWPELAKWYQMCIFKDWFDLTATSIISRQPGHDKTWRIDAVPWSETNTESFAGLHNQGKRLLLIFDEASAIADMIWEVAEGALTDKGTQILWLCFGNPTRSSGRFYQCFNRYRHRWWTQHIDGRKARMTNKQVLQQYAEDYGEDSDFFKVRVRGEFPSQSVAQLIPTDAVEAAMARDSEEWHAEEHRIAVVGVDIAMFGDDSTCFVTKMGREVVDIKQFRKRGTEVCSWLADHITELYEKYGLDKVYCFMDAGGVGRAHVDLMHKMGYSDVVGINFGGDAQQKTIYKNKRAEMWGRMRDWLVNEEVKLPYDEELKTDLISPEYFYDVRNRLQLEAKKDMKARGLASPDKADALALCFAQRVFEPPPRAVEHMMRAAEATKASRYRSSSSRRR